LVDVRKFSHENKLELKPQVCSEKTSVLVTSVKDAQMPILNNSLSCKKALVVFCKDCHISLHDLASCLNNSLKRQTCIVERSTNELVCFECGSIIKVVPCVLHADIKSMLNNVSCSLCCQECVFAEPLSLPVNVLSLLFYLRTHLGS
jgi:hypothetical protein